MGSLPTADSPPTLLSYLRSRSQVDVDSLDIEVASKLGPFADCTGNQAESYAELQNPSRAALLKTSAALARQLLPEYGNVTYEELAFEISMVSLSLSIVPYIAGCIHVMANPRYCYSTPKTVENAKRLYRICKHLDPSFDTTRLVIKVTSTWEGLQACRELTTAGVKTLATCVFSMEQVVLAAEVGCVSISPFVHELKAHFDESYHDDGAQLDINVQAQNYYKQHSYPIRVKACASLTTDEILQLAGVAALTIPSNHLYELDGAFFQSGITKSSLFDAESTKLPHQTYVDDEARYRTDLNRNGNGKYATKLIQAINIFIDHQLMAEEMIKAVV